MRLYLDPWHGQTYWEVVAPVMVQPSCVHVPSITVKVVSLVREMRNKPALDSTRAAPPTLASGVPVVVTRTRAFANEPGSWARSVADPPPPPLGPVGDPSPPQPVTMVASVAHEATQVPQNLRREMGVVVSDMSNVTPGRLTFYFGNMGATGEILGFSAKVRSGADGRLQLRSPAENSVRPTGLQGSIGAAHSRGSAGA